MDQLKIGRYRHFKGDICEVLGIARHSETLEELVVYRHMTDSGKFGNNAIWARPKGMFFETVQHNGEVVPRFRFVGEEDLHVG